jgi:uncharacterized membrane protein (UPF0127 family)
MKRRILLISIFLFIFLIIILLSTELFKGKQNQVCFKNYCFDVELALTPEEMSRGLMFRDHLDANQGMIFVFDKERDYQFWMENTMIPLDIIWIDENREVVFISENAQPCKEYSCPVIEPAKNAKYVLEINGGVSGNIGLKPKDEIDLKINGIIGL